MQYQVTAWIRNNPDHEPKTFYTLAGNEKEAKSHIRWKAAQAFFNVEKPERWQLGLIKMSTKKALSA